MVVVVGQDGGGASAAMTTMFSLAPRTPKAKIKWSYLVFFRGVGLKILYAGVLIQECCLEKK